MNRRHADFGSKLLSDIGAYDVTTLYSKLQTARGVSPRVVRYVHWILSSSLRSAVKLGLVKKNPADTKTIELPKQRRREMQALTPEQAQKFLKAAADDRHALLFNIALVTGMRPEEFLGLQWKDFHADHGTLTVHRVLCWRRKGGGWYFSEPKTERSRRTIPLPTSLVHSLVDHKREQAKHRLKTGSAYENLGLIFASETGSPLHPQNLLRRHLRPVLKRSGLPQSIRMYDFRHSCATLLLSSNVNPKIVAERLGHSSITLTLDTYSHVSAGMQQTATDDLASILYGSRKTRRR